MNNNMVPQLLIAVFFMAQNLYSARFEFAENKLTVKSDALEVVVDGGAVTSLRNLKSDDNFTNANLRGQAAALFNSRSKDVRPGSGSDAEFKQISPYEGTITYRNLVNGDVGDSCSYKIMINGNTGEIGIQTVYRLANASKTPAGIPLVNIAGKSVILGRGKQYFRHDAPATDSSPRVANGLYAPAVCIVEAEKSVVFIYNDAFDDRGTAILDHKTDCDNILLVSERDYRETDGNTTTSLVWNLGVHPDWFAAAKRYRKLFKEKTGAALLWENNCKWVRNIHSVHKGQPVGGYRNPKPEAADEYYKKLAGIVDPDKTLLFYWNGDGIVLFGDHRYMTNLGHPKPHVVDALKKHGFRWFAYHPYFIIIAPNYVNARLERIKAQGWGLPKDYTFQPDYPGRPEDFHNYFRDVAAGLYAPLDKADSWIIHLGSRKVRNYLIENYHNYCKFHRADGAYLDVLGSGHSGSHFTPDKKVIEGLDHRDGEKAFLKELAAKYPDLPVMSEYHGEHALALRFYSWEGMNHFYHVSAPPMNHPFRTAVWGGFSWAMEQYHTPYESALVGALPEIDMIDAWSVARASLFNEAGLHNDQPDKWDDHLVAHYRSKDGKVYQYRKMPFGEAFVKINGEQTTPVLGVFNGVSESPLPEPAKIVGWVGYKNNRPVGLNPAVSYPFIPENPSAGDTYTVSGLPGKAFIAGIRHGKKWSVLEMATADGTPVAGRVTITFHRDCLRVNTADREMAGPFRAGERKMFDVKLPDGLVFVWEEPEAIDGRFRSNLVTETGRMAATGVQDQQFAYNSFIGARNATFNNITLPAIDVGIGKYRGYSEGWVELATNARPVLKFDLGYPGIKERRLSLHEVEASVMINGKEIWKTDVKEGTEWQPLEIPLDEFAGRKVLVTMSAKSKGYKDIPAAPEHRPVSFGRVRVDNNPDSLELKTIKGPSTPAKIIFAEKFAGGKLGDEWKREISPANSPDGKMEVENGMLALTSKHYKYCYIYRKSEAENKNMSVQARLRISPTGGALGWNPGIGLYWNKSRHLFITGGAHRRDNGRISVRGYASSRDVDLAGDKLAVTDDNMYEFWVKIALSTDRISYFYSGDGTAWKLVQELARPADMSDAPTVIVGKGSAGEGAYFSNDERWNTKGETNYILEVVAGKE